MSENVNSRFWRKSLEVQIGRDRVGRHRPVYVIAEAGVNHNGDIDRALALVDAAKRCSADAVKFQVFSADTLVVNNAPTAEYQAAQGHRDQREMLRQLELTRDEFARLFDYCRDVRIEFLATPFTIDDLEFVLEVGVNAIKLASTDLVNIPLLERAIGSTLPVIVSTGACTMNEIDVAVETFADAGAMGSLILMHCISSYPARLADANLSVISELVHRHAVPVGFSDHTIETMTGALAVASGASVLEKHFTLDKSLPGPDHSFSLIESELKEYVVGADQAHAALGSPWRTVLPCEEEVRTVSRGSVVSRAEIPAGTLITPAVLTVKRPGGGIEPGRIKDVVGLVAQDRIPADTVIHWDMLRSVNVNIGEALSSIQ